MKNEMKGLPVILIKWKILVHVSSNKASSYASIIVKLVFPWHPPISNFPGIIVFVNVFSSQNLKIFDSIEYIFSGSTDLYGLLLFLGVDPFWVKQWWTKLLYEPYCHGNKEPMIDLVSKVMWRTAKHDVLDQVREGIRTA